mmetsp:Transcript_14347/g.26980  ORF Transcript_14347/g.26980 Transcript_14347/m.26980 type:complete len:166 (-) Transcript_14347:17-514(-)
MEDRMTVLAIGFVAGALTATFFGKSLSSSSKDSSKTSKKTTLYERLGGSAAIEAAVDKFYIKVLADSRINHWFAKTNMAHQHRQQKKFLIGALGGPNEYGGRTMDKAHAKLVKEGLSDKDFDAVAENLQNTLLEMGVDKDLVSEVIGAVAGLRDQVLCRGEWKLV